MSTDPLVEEDQGARRQEGHERDRQAHAHRGAQNRILRHPSTIGSPVLTCRRRCTRPQDRHGTHGRGRPISPTPRYPVFMRPSSILASGRAKAFAAAAVKELAPPLGYPHGFSLTAREPGSVPSTGGGGAPPRHEASPGALRRPLSPLARCARRGGIGRAAVIARQDGRGCRQRGHGAGIAGVLVTGSVAIRLSRRPTLPPDGVRGTRPLCRNAARFRYSSVAGIGLNRVMCSLIPSGVVM